MWKGSVVAICVAGEPGEPLATVAEAHAVPGRGLEGDRYFKQARAFPEQAGADAELTLIEIEAIEALAREVELELKPAEARRNIITRGVPLNHLVGREFRIGDVRVRGLRLCEPCSHLARLTEQRVLSGLIHRGGLRAQILTDGLIRVGDAVREAE